MDTGVLIHFAFAGEKGTPVPICKWLLNGTTNGLGSIDSEIHDTNIDLDSMIGLFSNPYNREVSEGTSGTRDPLGVNYCHFAEGEDLWLSKRTIGLWENLESHILMLALFGHRVEAMVCECSLLSDTASG